ncbi:putative ORFan [Tupanvirus deep ocean]|uniref:ORFan n=2 Tax=Tupanvirus TaxID=2094720 RepID=A0AC62A6T5_9VIRU|nr:putative ORFan [Tupanvirus deep ocean]QKU33500.1 putative ORFan [Tupanvirus deep ocean]
MEANALKYIFENYPGMEFLSLEHFYQFIKDKCREYHDKQTFSIDMDVDEISVNENHFLPDVREYNEIIINGDLEGDPGQFISDMYIIGKKRKRCEIENSNDFVNMNTINNLMNSFLVHKKSRYN